MLVAIAYNINKRMHIHTHGSKGDPVIIILHPMGITGEKLYNSENGYNTGGCPPPLQAAGSNKLSQRRVTIPR